MLTDWESIRHNELYRVLTAVMWWNESSVVKIARFFFPILIIVQQCSEMNVYLLSKFHEFSKWKLWICGTLQFSSENKKVLLR